MSEAMENLQTAQQRAMAGRPKVGGFSYLAETLRQAGVTKNIWTLPAAESLYLTDKGPVVMQGTPLVSGMIDVPAFDEASVIAAIRADQAGESTFPEFLQAVWQAGIVRYIADFTERTVAYYGSNDEQYIESYSIVEI